MSKPLILVPVNRLERAKGRLATLLTAEERAGLALATFTTVLAALRATGSPVRVLTSDPAVAALAGGEASEEDATVSGLNAQLESALRRLGLEEGGLLILHADLPLATAEAIGRLFDAAPPAPSVTLVRSRDGGTNAMLLNPPGRFPLAYGPNSHDLHVTAARAAGMRTASLDIPELALDLDTPDDLEALLAVPGGADTPAGKIVTRALARDRSP